MGAVLGTLTNRITIRGRSLDMDALHDPRIGSPAFRQALRQQFESASPFPHLVLDGLFVLSRLHSASPLGELLGWSWAIFLASLPLGLLIVATVPRILGSFLKPGRIYKLYGLHHMLQQNVTAIGNSKFYNTLFGDSSAIVHYLAWIGCRFPNLRQTGSNFGLAQQLDNPALCEFGSGTMISDGLTMLNADYGRHVFRVSQLRLGADNFVGNRLLFPSEARTGDNCLFGTKVMVPIDGPLREGVGLLGSPSFEIPRSVDRDSRLAVGPEQVPGLLAGARFAFATFIEAMRGVGSRSSA